MSEIVVLIPTYQCTENLIDLVCEIHEQTKCDILIVNDGSDEHYDPIFVVLEQQPGVRVLHHATNMGKGAALKTGINDILVNCADTASIVTADADGQHLVKDISALVTASRKRPNELILGCREFDKDVPLRSRFGNILTRYVFWIATGEMIADTQTGLRAIPRQFAQGLLRLSAVGYEFEIDMLLEARRNGTRISEVPIETVYLDGNATSHFNPLIDSVKIYFSIIRYSAASLISAVTDIFVFVVMLGITGNILISHVTSRSVSLGLNFSLVKTMVFKSDKGIFVTFSKYLLVVIASGTVSYFGQIGLIQSLSLSPLLAKISVESILFGANFLILRDFVFAQGRTKVQ